MKNNLIFKYFCCEDDSVEMIFNIFKDAIVFQVIS